MRAVLARGWQGDPETLLANRMANFPIDLSFAWRTGWTYWPARCEVPAQRLEATIPLDEAEGTQRVSDETAPNLISTESEARCPF